MAKDRRLPQQLNEPARVQLILEVEDLKRVDSLADACGVSRSACIRLLIQSGLDQEAFIRLIVGSYNISEKAVRRVLGKKFAPAV